MARDILKTLKDEHDTLRALFDQSQGHDRPRSEERAPNCSKRSKTT